VENGLPILGVVYRPTTQELYYAQKRSGAFKEVKGVSQRIFVSKLTSISNAKFVVSKLDDKHSGYMNRIGVVNRTRVGSAALKICKVAQGEYDAYFVLKARMSEWDDCAAEIILSEAGGTLSNVFGDPMLIIKKMFHAQRGCLRITEVFIKSFFKN
jgi:fructose-1,6-bisphosphatase/inositol monophosphatase family enzyme